MECDYTGEYFQFQVCHVYDSCFDRADPGESAERPAESADWSANPPENYFCGVPVDPRGTDGYTVVDCPPRRKPHYADAHFLLRFVFSAYYTFSSNSQKC